MNNSDSPDSTVSPELTTVELHPAETNGPPKEPNGPPKEPYDPELDKWDGSGSRIFTMRDRVFKIIATATGFITDTYDVFCINHVLYMLQVIYGASFTGVMASWVSTATIICAVFGMLTFATFSTRFSNYRLKGFIITISLVIFGSFGSGFFTWGDITSVSVVLIIMRAILGFGVGGEYPLSANVSRDGGGTATDSAIVFSMQGVGSLFSALVTMFAITVMPIDWAWRFVLIFGGIIGCVALPLRLFVVRKYHNHNHHHTKSTVPFKTKAITFFKTILANWKNLLGTSGSWFLIDVSFYGNALFLDTILTLTGIGTGVTPSEKVFDKATLATYIALIALPGYALGALTSRKIGVKYCQFFGFCALFLLYGAMAIWFDSLKTIPVAFMICYALTFLFTHWGPNTTTYIMPVQEGVFSEDFRTMGHGISAAIGKVGAVVGTLAINAASKNSVSDGLIISSMAALLGAILTFVIFMWPEKWNCSKCKKTCPETCPEK